MITREVEGTLMITRGLYSNDYEGMAWYCNDNEGMIL